MSAPQTVGRGEDVRVIVSGHAGESVHVWLHSEPELLSTGVVSAAGDIVVTIPADADLGAHRIVVQAADGSLIGWAPVELVDLALADIADPGQPSDGLAKTGWNFTPLVGAALAALFAGVLLRRRRV